MISSGRPDPAPAPAPAPRAEATGPSPAAGWADLARELDRWGVAGRVATLWWRDDDAVAPTPALDRLLDIGRRSGVPIALAVIPEPATAALADRLASETTVTVLQHGWAHADHAAPAAKKTEWGDDRPVAAVLDEVERGRARLRTLFGYRFRADLLVPPWNRVGAAVADALAARGLGLSLYGGRPAQAPDRLDTHVDPIAWKAGGGFAGEAAALGLAVRHLAARRQGTADPAEPTGLLTHHRVHDAATWAFVERLAEAVAAHPAAAWVDVAAARTSPGRVGAA